MRTLPQSVTPFLTGAPPPKKNPGSAPVTVRDEGDLLKISTMTEKGSSFVNIFGGVLLWRTKNQLLTLLQRFFDSVLNGTEFLLLSMGLCEALGKRTTALNDFTGEPFNTKRRIID